MFLPVVASTEILFRTEQTGMYLFISIAWLRFVDLFYYPVPDTSGDGVLFSINFFVSFFLSFFLSFFVSLLARLPANGWTDLHETFWKYVE